MCVSMMIQHDAISKVVIYFQRIKKLVKANIFTFNIPRTWANPQRKLSCNFPEPLQFHPNPPPPPPLRCPSSWEYRSRDWFMEKSCAVNGKHGNRSLECENFWQNAIQATSDDVTQLRSSSVTADTASRRSSSHSLPVSRSHERRNILAD